MGRAQVVSRNVDVTIVGDDIASTNLERVDAQVARDAVKLCLISHRMLRRREASVGR